MEAASPEGGYGDVSEEHGEEWDNEAKQESTSPTGPDSTTGSKSAPLQKRRRVTRACDECRRKKIKCDGKQPCTHCTVYSYGKR